MCACLQVVRRAPWATPSLVYGALPPESRRHSAAVFNASNHPCDVLVASDAIGMGLNLAVQRVIFSSLTKFDGTCYLSSQGGRVQNVQKMYRLLNMAVVWLQHNLTAGRRARTLI